MAKHSKCCGLAQAWLRLRVLERSSARAFESSCKVAHKNERGTAHTDLVGHHPKGSFHPSSDVLVAGAGA